MKNVILLPVNAVLLCILLHGCDITAPQISFDRAEFERERAAWEAQGIANYTFDGKTGNDATGPLNAGITVTDGEITNVDEHYEHGDYRLFFKSVSGIYDEVIYYYEQTSATLKKGQSLRIDIRYNAQYHYPEYVYGGIYERNPPNGGGFMYYEILNFRPLP
jgi:hypothetical protein